MKLKTSKSANKRFKISSRGKFLHRKPRQNHFNARADGKASRLKKKQKILTPHDVANDLGHLLPYK